MWLSWITLAAAGVAALGADLWLARSAGSTSLRRAAVASGAWLVVGVAFAAVVRLAHGAAAATSYLTVFAIEKSLSLDNVAVFAVVLSTLAVPRASRPRVLWGGIVAAVVLRIAFISGGLAAVAALHNLLIAFGAVLIVAGTRMARSRAGSEHAPPIVDWLSRRRVTPVAAALVALAVTDVVFAVDSVPAAFAVTRDAYPIVAANVFAAVGLRPLYDLLAAALDRLSALQRWLGVLLVLIGAALCVQPVWVVPEWLLLATVVVTLALGVLTSLVPPRRLLVSIGGGVLLAAGAAMLVLPGPGLLVIAAGLALLATEFAWAAVLLARIRARLPRRSRSASK